MWTMKWTIARFHSGNYWTVSDDFLLFQKTNTEQPLWEEPERVLRNSFAFTPESLRERYPGITKFVIFAEQYKTKI